MRDGRLLTTDIGNNQSGPSDGQLTLWFMPIDGEVPRYCKLDITIGTAGAVYVDEQGRIYVASARGQAGIYRYSPPFPTSETAEGGCGARDDTGAPLADAVSRERFIAGDGNVPTPNAIVGSGHGTFYVSSILNGVIAEYDADGRFVRRVLEPPAGERLGPTPYSTGSPFGLAVDPSGTLYYADLALVVTSSGIGPGHRLGTVRRIRFAGGDPLPPETMDSGLAFPDGLGVYAP
jgi:sugar lactone lactonase YvrE